MWCVKMGYLGVPFLELNNDIVKFKKETHKYRILTYRSTFQPPKREYLNSSN